MVVNLIKFVPNFLFIALAVPSIIAAAKSGSADVTPMFAQVYRATALIFAATAVGLACKNKLIKGGCRWAFFIIVAFWLFYDRRTLDIVTVGGIILPILIIYALSGITAKCVCYACNRKESLERDV